ncbi:MAG: cell division protein ZapA [Deltaproteobacteria bacterium]|nr:cell division protein ZapA [Deltaproteobacteria bacterium]
MTGSRRTGSSGSAHPVRVEILGNDFVLRSGQGEEQIQRVANYLNGKLNEILSTTRTSSTLAAAVLAALNITHELLELKDEREKLLQEIEEKTEKLLARMERAVI